MITVCGNILLIINKMQCDKLFNNFTQNIKTKKNCVKHKICCDNNDLKQKYN